MANDKAELEEIFSTEEEQSDPNIVEQLAAGDIEVFTSPSDPDIRTLLGRIEDKSLILHPKFQRSDVWDQKRKSRLIESVLLNLPIPPCFLAEDEDGTRVVVDGQQRLIAIDDFYHGRYALSDLEVLSDLNGKKWKDLPPKQDRKILQRVVRTLTISYHTNQDLRFIIFERLNTGAVPLVDQEIRNATLGGPFNDLLNDLANDVQFLGLMRKEKPDSRLRHHEIILRFFAIEANIAGYRPPLKLLLTNYMKENRKLAVAELAKLRAIFSTGLENSKIVFGDDAFRKFSAKNNSFERPVSRAVFDLQMISLCSVDKAIVVAKAPEILRKFKERCGDVDFVESLTRAIDHKRRVYLRFRKWLGDLESIGAKSQMTDRLPKADE